MTGRGELERWLNRYLNVGAVRDHLPNGLQVEGAREVKRVLTAVSISADVIEQAVREGADTIVVHHGMFWKHDDPTVRGYRKTRIERLLSAGINLFAYHLPLDLHPEISHNRLIIERLGAVVREAAGGELGFGLEGDFPAPIDFAELLARVNRVLSANAGAFHFGPDTVGSIFVVSGAGRTLIDKIAALGVDAYITGDAQESTGSIAKEEGLNYIHAGHYNTEKVGIVELGNRIRETFGIDVAFFDSPNPL